MNPKHLTPKELLHYANILGVDAVLTPWIEALASALEDIAELEQTLANYQAAIDKAENALEMASEALQNAI